MSCGDSNPAAVPHAAEDTQGDDRWMSQVRELSWEVGASFLRAGGCWVSAARVCLTTFLI